LSGPVSGRGRGLCPEHRGIPQCIPGVPAICRYHGQPDAPDLVSGRGIPECRPQVAAGFQPGDSTGGQCPLDIGGDWAHLLHYRPWLIPVNFLPILVYRRGADRIRFHELLTPPVGGRVSTTTRDRAEDWKPRLRFTGLLRMHPRQALLLGRRVWKHY
jgi:hypothetical protein